MMTTIVPITPHNADVLEAGTSYSPDLEVAAREGLAFWQALSPTFAQGLTADALLNPLTDQRSGVTTRMNIEAGSHPRCSVRVSPSNGRFLPRDAVLILARLGHLHLND